MRRKDREMNEEFAFDVCDRCDFATIAMIDSCGEPYCVPINIARDKQDIYFHCAKTGFKIDALANNNSVCISCVCDVLLDAENFTTKYSSGILRGKACEVLDSGEKIHAMKLLCEKYAKSNMGMFDTELEKHISHTAVWKVEVINGTGKRHI